MNKDSDIYVRHAQTDCNRLTLWA